MVKFSIIVGLYNQKQYLPRLIESLNNQTVKGFEAHFCDDGSNDGTREYLNNMGTTFFPWYYHRLGFKRGMRLAKTVNMGIRKANGEYCVFIMGDSFPELNYLEVLDQYVKPHRFICGVRVHVEGKRIVEMDWRLKKDMVPDMPVLLPSKAFNHITGNGLTIPTEAMKLYGGWDERITGYGGDDDEIVARLYYKGYTVWSVPQLILYHNYHPGRTTPAQNMEYVRERIEAHAQ